MTAGSIQLRTYRIARRTQPMAVAATMAGIEITEANLIDADDAKYPPGPECFEPIAPPPPAGHNSGDKIMSTDTTGDQLRLLIERIERLESDKSDIAADIKDVYSEAKSRGFDAKVMRKIIALRKMDANDRAEMEAVLETYQIALGMLAGTPLGDWAKSMHEMDTKGIGVSMGVGDGPMVPLNKTAAAKAT